jgi:hypothetical protein
MASAATNNATSNRSEKPDADGARDEQNNLNGRANSQGKDEGDEKAGDEEKKPSAIGKAWKKLDLDIGTVLMMMK